MLGSHAFRQRNARTMSKAEDSMTPQGFGRRLECWSTDGRNSVVHEAGELGDLKLLRINWSLKLEYIM